MRPSRAVLARLFYLALSLLLFGLDRLSKSLVVARLPLYESVPVIEDFFHLTHVANTGALFGLLAGMASPLRGLIFITIPVLAILLILAFQFRTQESDFLVQAGLSLILGGAMGNLYDRVALGHVVDFLDFSVAGHHWPAVNLADSSICLGVFTLVLDLFRRERPVAPAA
ncbi:MAG TPA: signal peptidase II [Candidatus Polarisedimenticolia bacterium]|nr:signal peptidase II [Candidatus Polarisedimenticolia bacterium]